MVTETVDLSDGLHEAIRSIAARTDQSVPNVIVEILREQLLRQPVTKRLGRNGIASDPGFSSKEIDKWFAENWRPEENWKRNEPPSR